MLNLRMQMISVQKRCLDSFEFLTGRKAKHFSHIQIGNQWRFAGGLVVLRPELVEPRYGYNLARYKPVFRVVRKLFLESYFDFSRLI